MGALAPGSAHTRPSTQPPIDTSGICLAHCLGVGQRISFQVILSTFPKIKLKIDPPGGRVVPQFLFYPKSYFFVT